MVVIRYKSKCVKGIFYFRRIERETASSHETSRGGADKKDPGNRGYYHSITMVLPKW